MLSALNSTVTKVLATVEMGASAVYEVAATVESLASTAHEAADKWGEHIIANLEFGDEDNV